jgi:transcriptional regulator with XRE-family HTH domain
MKFQYVLKELRTNKKMTQAELAEAIKTKRANIGNWESGRVSPDYSMVVKLAEFFGVTTDYLFGNNYNVTKDMPVIVFSQEDVDLVKRVRALPPVGQKMMMETLKNLEEILNEPSATKEDLA